MGRGPSAAPALTVNECTLVLPIFIGKSAAAG